MRGGAACGRAVLIGCGGPYLASPSSFMLKGSSLSASGSRLFSRSIRGTVWSMPIWMRRRIMDISFTFWICSAYLAKRFCLSCMMLKSVSTDRSICRQSEAALLKPHIQRHWCVFFVSKQKYYAAIKKRDIAIIVLSLSTSAGVW